MDLITHVPGVTNSGSFTPGGTTPAPFNIAHTGLVNGSGPASASKNVAEIYNRLLLDRAALINMLGATLDNTNWAQASAVLKAYLDTMSSNTAGLNTNLNTLSSGLTAEIAARQAGEVKRCGLRRNSSQTVANNTEGVIGWDVPMGQAWNSGSTIVIPAGTANGTWFRAYGSGLITRNVGSTSAVAFTIKKGAAGVGLSNKSVDPVGDALVFDCVFQANAGDAISLSLFNFTGGSIEVADGTCFVVERF